MPSTSTQPACPSASSTWCRLPRSILRLPSLRRSRNRLEVRLRNAMAPGPCPAERNCAAASATRPAWSLAAVSIQVLPRHRVAGMADVALAEQHLEQMGLAAVAAEHLGATHQVAHPDAPEALVETRRVQCLDGRPVRRESLCPGV